jgi:ribonuclease HI
MSWVKKKKCRTKLARSDRNARLFDLVDKAEYWLENNSYDNKILKWDTANWGEIPADFGRK